VAFFLRKIMNYETLIKQVESLISDDQKQVSILANICALLKEELKHFWIGFYIVDEIKNELYLGPFQGPLACTKIEFGKGVCGSSWKEARSLVVANVHEFEGHIACSSKTNSEIVIPIIKNKNVVAVLDIDSEELNTFNELDRVGLERVCSKLSSLF
jgi:GAF domain-containing protein